MAPTSQDHAKTFLELRQDFPETLDSVEMPTHSRILEMVNPVIRQFKLLMMASPGRGQLTMASMGWQVELKCDAPRDRMHRDRQHPSHPIPNIHSMVVTIIQAMEHTMEGYIRGCMDLGFNRRRDCLASTRRS